MTKNTVVERYELPNNPDAETIYRLLPVNPSDAFYRERTDRNIGWITEEEQEILRRSTVGVAGCGGMGGLIASILLRAGIGEIRIADSEEFDVSNINRQFAAMRTTVGKPKAFETARLMRQISDDTTVVVYPQGVTEETVDHFASGCDVICDEIEFLVVDARIALHRHARSRGISVFNCNTAGFATHLFLYTPESVTMEEVTGLTYEEANGLRERMLGGDTEATKEIAEAMMRAVAPERVDYSAGEHDVTFKRIYERAFEEMRGPIIATNPPMATGFLADRVLLYLLRNSGIHRTVLETPEMPAYLFFDAARMQTKVIQGRWW